MQTPGRDTVFKNGYRYGFNGKEIDNEPYGQGNEYDYGMRIYNPRIGKFLSVDPLIKSYPQLTPYQFSSNTPIANVDLDGKESEYYTTTITYTTTHRTELNGDETTYTESQNSTAHESRNGWLWGLIPNNGPLGTGTLYTVQTQVIDVYENASGLPIPSVKKSEPITIGNFYKLSESDEKLMNEKIDRPQYTGKYQIMIVGAGNGMYPGDQTGSKPNPVAKTVLVDIDEWNNIFEPILLGMDVKSPNNMEPPKIDELMNQAFEQNVDKYKEMSHEMPDVNIGYCETCHANFKLDKDGNLTWDSSGVQDKVPFDTTTDHGTHPDRQTKSKTKNEKPN